MREPYVVYLFWGPLGIEPLVRFAASYRSHPAGRRHRLLVLLKGLESGVVAQRCRALIAELDAECVEVAATGLDLDAYREAAQGVDADALCFLNTSSEILADGWLAVLGGALEQPGVGIVGSTGSYESILSSTPAPLRPLLRLRYPPFPNPHVRTNGFMLERDLMLNLRWPATTRKWIALALENGARSVTRQVTARGLLALVVGRDGSCYEPERWHQSRTYRGGSQENLLIADNRTREYAEADPARRSVLARFAWGDRADGDPV
jgi:hypothetical protein